jgi:hypothetical protein
MLEAKNMRLVHNLASVGREDAFARRLEGLQCSRLLSGLLDSILASTPGSLMRTD